MLLRCSVFDINTYLEGDGVRSNNVIRLNKIKINYQIDFQILINNPKCEHSIKNDLQDLQRLHIDPFEFADAFPRIV